jgi:hypothetical protein
MPHTASLSTSVLSSNRRLMTLKRRKERIKRITNRMIKNEVSKENSHSSHSNNTIKMVRTKQQIRKRATLKRAK